MSHLTRWSLAGILGCLLLFAAGGPAPLFAQPENAAGADNAAANQVAAGDAGGQQQAGEPQSSTRSGSYLWWFIRCSGLIGLFILALSIYFVATVIRLFLEMRQEVAAPPELVQQCAELTRSKEFAAMYTVVREEDSFLGRVVATGLAELSHDLSEARVAMERVADAETVKLEKQISMLAVLGTLGPMIGLIGTLKGMISSFSAIAMSGEQLNASRVAEGISEALLLTFEGVALSVPAIYFYAVFRNRVSTISAAVMVQADQILRDVAKSLRHAGPEPALKSMAPTSAPPPPVRTSEDRPRPLPLPKAAQAN